MVLTISPNKIQIQFSKKLNLNFKFDLKSEKRQSDCSLQTLALGPNKVKKTWKSQQHSSCSNTHTHTHTFWAVSQELSYDLARPPF